MKVYLTGKKCGFQYVASGNEIYAFNYTGGITEIFSYYKNGIIYGVREEKKCDKRLFGGNQSGRENGEKNIRR